jgi:hypothetical protein
MLLGSQPNQARVPERPGEIHAEAAMPEQVDRMGPGDRRDTAALHQLTE